MTEQKILDRLNADQPQFLLMLGGRSTAADVDNKTCTMEFNIDHSFCHSVDVVQGGFVTAMLDAAMSHGLFVADESVVNVSSLEIKTSFLEPTHAGRLLAVGKVARAGYKIAFLEGQLFDESGRLTATSSSVAKLDREPSA